jgi:tight adherence protein G
VKPRRLLAEQRGAITVLAGLSMVVVIASAALSVDVGKAAWQKRSLQRLVDVVSLDTVRAVGDREDALVDAYTKAVQFAQEAATRNDFAFADTSQGNAIQVELGSAVYSTKAFTVITDPALYGTANAVRVTAWHRNDHNFMPGSETLVTQAVAMIEPEATFSLGSRLAQIDTTSSPILNTVLKQMLGTGVNLDVLSYQGLAAASVTFGAVWTQLGLGTTDQILNSSVNVRNFLTASAAALNNQGDPASVTAASILGTLTTQVSSSLSFKFGDMLQLASGDPGDAANAKMNILEMVGMAAQLANGDNLMNLTVPITIPGVTTMKLALIEKPVVASGPIGTTAHTAQARIQLDLTLAQKLTVLLSQGTVHLPVYIEAAGADGELTNIACAVPASGSSITVRTTTNALTAKIGQATDASMTNTTGPAVVNPAQIVSIAGLVNVTGTATASVPTSVTDVLVPLNQIVGTGGGGNPALAAGLGSTLQLTVQVLGLGINAGAVANNTLAILNPILATLDTTLLAVLRRALGSLGILVGGADVGNLDTRCGARRLIG